MFNAISPVTTPCFALSKVIALKTSTENRNHVLRTLGLAINSYVTTDNAQIIWIHEQAFAT